MIRPLRAAGVRRAIALLLTAVFLGAGTSVPGPDALLHHGGDAAEQHRSHIEPAGGCTSHADSCTLGRTATGAGAALALAPVVRLGAGHGTPRSAAPRAAAPAAPHELLPPPRAPPLPVA